MIRNQHKFTISLLATEMDARQAISDTSGRLRSVGISEHRADEIEIEIEIALAEAINNVVEHAYAGKEPGLIKVLCSIKPGQLDIRISDVGAPLPQHRLPESQTRDVSGPKHNLPEVGFGWFLIRQLTNEIQYERRGSENHLLLRFDIPGK